MNDSGKSVRDILRSHDPAREKTLDEREARLMRARITDQVQPDLRVSHLRPMLALATVLVAITGGWLLFDAREPADPVVATTAVTIESAPPEPAVVEEKPTRQVQYTTPGGTRVIWTLDPDFQL